MIQTGVTLTSPLRDYGRHTDRTQISRGKE